MALKADFSALWREVRRVTGVQAPFEVNLRRHDDDPIDIALREGKELDLSEIDVEDGLLLHKGRQVLLYIRDHSGRVSAAMEFPFRGNKFHVANCQTLESMRSENRFERYVATNDLSGLFHITDEAGGWPREGRARLRVCMNCLDGLNYQSFRLKSDKKKKIQIVSDFSLGEFFSNYSSCFSYLPRRWDSDPMDSYADDWEEISRRVREERGYQCASCRVQLRDTPWLCHVHHKDGVKANNEPENLEVLCSACHRERPGHRGLFVRRADMQTILKLRQGQKLVKTGWASVIKEADPAIQDALKLLEALGASAPEIGWDVLDDRGVVADYADAAWPAKRTGICVRRSTLKSGWNLWTFAEALAKPKEFLRLIEET